VILEDLVRDVSNMASRILVLIQFVKNVRRALNVDLIRREIRQVN
jgi:hypothetical protein